MTKKSVMLGEISARELHGPWSDFMQKLQGDDGRIWFQNFKRFLRKENPWPVRRWREEDGVIYLSVTSDGTTGPEWIERFKWKFRLSDPSRRILCSPDFKPTNGVTTEIAILKGTLFVDFDRVMKNICAEASKRRLSKPNAEVACLIRENFSDEEMVAMGLKRVVVMHEPIQDGNFGFYYLDVTEGCWMFASFSEHEYGWRREHGFAFAISETNGQ